MAPIPEATHADADASPEAAPPTSPPNLPHDAGELWVHLRGDDVDASIEALCEMVLARGLGEWSGDSHGGGSSDLSFDVEGMNRAGQEISSFLREQWPATRFLVSDQYEPEVFTG